MIEGLSEKENELVLRALREFSESCEPPELIPECPFSVEIGPNERGCLEECMDLLGKHEAPRPRRLIQIESGIQVSRPIRPRSRRGKDPSWPFDAKEIFLQDSSQSDPLSWRLPALLYYLRESVAHPPDSGREIGSHHDQTTDVIHSLERRGLDFSAMVEPGIRFYAGRAVFGQVYAQWRSNRSSGATPIIDAWVALLDSIVPPTTQIGNNSQDGATLSTTPERADDAYSCLIGNTRTWSRSASFDDILAWNPPGVLDREQPTQDDVARFHNSHWLFDRFTVTYLEAWRTESLRREWQYAHGERGSPWPSHEMKSRTITQLQLAQTMADRLLRLHKRSHMPSLTDQMVGPALGFLGEGRRVEAAALFEAALRYDSEDASAHNNLAFCLIPDQPELALEMFEKAVKLGGPYSRLYEANRIATLAYIGNVSRAMSLAVEFMSAEGSRTDTRGSNMWNVQLLLRDRKAVISECEDLREYVESVLTMMEG